MKKIQIIKNSKNKIIGTTDIPQGNDVIASILPEKDHKMVELEVPDNFVFSEKRKLQLIKDSKGKLIASIEADEEFGIPITLEMDKTHNLDEVEESGHYLLDIEGFYKTHSKK